MAFDEMRGFAIFDGLPDEALRALVDASDEVTFRPGDLVWSERDPAVYWWVLLDGRMEMLRHVGRERAVMGEFTDPGQWGEGWGAFDPRAVNLVSTIGLTDGRLLRVPVAALRAVVEEVPLIRHFLDGLFQTARQIETTTRQREALVALGTLSAGLAHELNNPVAAASRSAAALETAMHETGRAVRRLADARIDASQYAALDDLATLAAVSGAAEDALATSDREERLSAWMSRHGIDREWELAPALASASLEPEWCDRVLDTVGSEALQPALEWLASSITSRSLLAELSGSTRAISGLVDSVKSYSQMDRGPVHRIDVRDGLESTLAVLAQRLRTGVEVVRRYEADVPPIEAYAGELNQVWTGLIENAVDAMGGVGVLTLGVSGQGHRVVVTVEDTGSGMPPEVLAHAFDTFFTTKEIGMGTGLGLAIARRVIVDGHGGDIAIESQPGRTVVRVSLPTK